MKRLFLMLYCCITVSLFITVAAHASTLSTVSFDFRYLELPFITGGKSLSFTEDGLKLNATAMSGGSTSWVNRTPLGLGVSSSLWPPDDFRIDGLEREDLLILEFDQEVTINSASFAAIWKDDDFQLFVDGVSRVSADIPGDHIYTFQDTEAQYRTGRIFGFSVTETNDDYLLSGMTVEIAQAPIPAAGLLFASSMAGLLVVRKKRRSINK